MVSWSQFAELEPALAAYGEARFNRARVAFIATVADDGSPRVNPVHPVICEGRLLLFIEPTSPKLNDLSCNGLYALHSMVDNPTGIGGEFSVKGTASCIENSAVRQQAIAAACYTPAENFELFELQVDAALARDYEDGHWTEKRWDAAPAAV